MRARFCTVFFVMGPTCSGKSTLLRLLEKRIPEDQLGLVEVGKAMRSKYPPDYFKGQCNPKHTQEEAWRICEEAVNDHRDAGRSFIVVDGQPRDIGQVHLCLSRFPFADGFRTEYILLDANLEERERRARATRSGADLETLALPRLTNDMVAYYGVLVELLKFQRRVMVFDTSNPKRLSMEVCLCPLVKWMKYRHSENEVL